MKNERMRVYKLIAFFVALVLFIVMYCVTNPTKGSLGKPYTYHIFSMIYTGVIICSVAMIDFRKIAKNDLRIALICGVLSCGVTIPINIMGILSAVCTLFAYLASRTLVASYKNSMCFIRSRLAKDSLDNVRIIVLIGALFVFLRWFMLLKEGKMMDIQFQLPFLFESIGASVSEEIIFRMFLFSVMLRMNEGKEPPKLIAYFVMIVPFCLLHNIEGIIFNGFLSIVPTVIIQCLIGTILAILAHRRDLVTAIGVHFLLDTIHMMMRSV